MNEDAPLTITQVEAERINDEAPYKFRLDKTTQNVSGPL